MIQYYGTGRRKTAAARVYLRPGAGNIEVNRRTFDEYFVSEALKMVIQAPECSNGGLAKEDVVNGRALDEQVEVASIRWAGVLGCQQSEKLRVYPVASTRVGYTTREEGEYCERGNNSEEGDAIHGTNSREIRPPEGGRAVTSRLRCDYVVRRIRSARRMSQDISYTNVRSVPPA